MEKIINSLLDAIRALGIEAILAPQTASPSRPHAALFIAGIEPAGIDRHNAGTGNLGWERITFNAVFTSSGTHARWVSDTILALRTLAPLGEVPMSLSVTVDKTYQLTACWKRTAGGRFEYPDEADSSMPVRFVENWEVTVAYPAHIIGQGPKEQL